jgi:hypothetical protein
VRRNAAAVGLLAVLAVMAVACGDDGDSGSSGETGDAEAFCVRLEELQEEEGLDLDDDGAAAALEELADLAPEEIDGEVNRIQRAFEALSELDQDDPDAFEEVLELVYDPAVIRAFEAFADYADDECGIELEDVEDLSDAFTDDATADFSDDLSDDLSDDEPSPAEQIRTHLEENYASEGFSDLVGGIGTVEVADDDLQATLTLDEPADGETAAAICEAVVEFADQNGIDTLTVEVEDDQDTILASGDQGGCEAA